MRVKNLFESVPEHAPEELFESLASSSNVQVERIISHGHASPPGFWYEQAEAECVLVLKGAARLKIESRSEEICLKPGDTLLIPAGCRHRVEWTTPDEPTVWLAIFSSGLEECFSEIS